MAEILSNFTKWHMVHEREKWRGPTGSQFCLRVQVDGGDGCSKQRGRRAQTAEA